MVFQREDVVYRMSSVHFQSTQWCSCLNFLLSTHDGGLSVNEDEKDELDTDIEDVEAMVRMAMLNLSQIVI